MFCPVLLLNEVSAYITLLSLSATGFLMVNPTFDTESLFTPLALLGSHVTKFFMCTELCRRLLERTILTFHKLVGVCLVFLTVGFGDDLATLSALVIITSTSYLMHPHFADLDWAFACRAQFSLFLSC